ncbi:hypothetical protein IM697_24055 [Streptomyces ferrugineus]|uniref:Uncharacterized protein n=1 Tax=Streptomyces ferrugineus TaxID=1413221 RepID=A0A7M2SCT7_9ACTN|nr:hypothetical protein [Streptomyces ferrugineus]QOV33308.1 hypothetical protein IM697_24055 [Streptomyces ferrugineus]
MDEQLSFSGRSRHPNQPEVRMSESDDEYWVDLVQDDDLLGGAFLVTRYYAMTLTDCVASLEVGDPVVLRMVDEAGTDVRGEIVDLQPEAGLALISVIAHPGQCLPTPRMDHATKGDDWRAPYTPPRVRRPLRGTVDDVVHDHPQEGPCRIAIHLATDTRVRNHAAFGGGPVERIIDETEGAPLVGVLMSPASPRFSHSPPHGVIATSIDSAMEAFPGLSALGLATSLIAGESPSCPPDTALVPAHSAALAQKETVPETAVHTGMHLEPPPEHREGDSNAAVLDISPTAELSTWSPQEIRDPVLNALCARTEDYLRFLDHLSDTELVESLDLDPFRVRSVGDLTDALRALQLPAGDEGGEA